MEYPKDILTAAENALDNLLCNTPESCGGIAGMRAESIRDIAGSMHMTKHDAGDRPEPDRPDIFYELVDSVVESVMAALSDPYSGGVSPLESEVRLAVFEGIDRVGLLAFCATKNR